MSTAKEETGIRSEWVARVGNTIFVPLPRSLWRLTGDGACHCDFCKAVPGRVAYWDTLAISATRPETGNDCTWTVHRPEHNPHHLQGREIDAAGNVSDNPGEALAGYWTVVIPYAPPALRTEWHPDTEVGPFSRLTRGAFSSKTQAITWARERLNGMPYEVRWIDAELRIATEPPPVRIVCHNAITDITHNSTNTEGK